MHENPSLRQAFGYIASTCFKTGPPGGVGVELEWLVRDGAEPGSRVDPSRITPRLPGDALAGVLSREPGGQIELSTPCYRDLEGCLAAATSDMARLRAALAPAGLLLDGDGLDPLRPPRRVLDLPRYEAMERHFDRAGPEGREMMCCTAAVQVSLDAGADDDDVRRRWQLLNRLAPVLVGAFANSPFRGGAATGWRSTRQRVWSRLDRSRTAPPPRAGATPRGAPGLHPGATYARYALDAQVMCVRRDGPDWSAPAGLTMRDWLRADGRGRLGHPSYDDLDYHLGTLFPPVRARGFLELRVIDAQPDDRWVAPVAAAYALVEDPVAADTVAAAVDRLDPATAMERAARDGLSDPGLAAAALACFGAALSALPRLGASARTVRAVENHVERYVARARTPADDRLDAFRRTGRASLLPAPHPSPTEEASPP
jgi:glutamate--cysteine ligase